MKKSKPFLISCLLFVFIGTFGQAQSIIFKRTQEPKENAFSFRLPSDWITEGGIFRIDPTAGGGSGNAIDAKLDFSMKMDQAGTVMMRWLPDMNYFDMSTSPAGQMGMFPTGSNYNGMMVMPKMSGLQFIQHVVIPYAHLSLYDYQVEEQKSSPEIVKAIKKADEYFNYPFVYDAGVMTISYTEYGIKYKENIISVTMDFGALGAGMWKNRFTLFGRAPYDEYEKWEPIFMEIIYSVKINMKWLIGEIQGQVTRGEISAEVLRKLQQMDKEIQDNTSKTYAEINNDMFLTLTEQEEYVNPYSKEVEIGSNQWQHRWVNESGDVVYSDVDDYDPNLDDVLNRTDYKKTPIRKR
jgi:hypothetical protein